VPTTPPTSRVLTVFRDHLTGDGPLDTATSRAILQRVTQGEVGEILEVGTPHRVMAFGKHDTLAPGFGDAVGIAASRGYDPTIRIAGGRAVVFAPSIIRFAWTLATSDPATTMRTRFSALAEAVVGALTTLGIASAIGEIPNEYCAGEYSVHVHGPRKIMGVGQRLTRSAAQVGGMIVVSDPDDINDVLVPVYAALDIPIDPSATGSIADVAPVRVDAVVDALIVEIAAGREVILGAPDMPTRTMAADLRSDHDPSRLAP